MSRKPYVRPISKTTWYMRNGRYRKYMLREVTCLLVEHDMGVVMDLSDRVVVMDYGKKIGDGTPHEVRNNPEVIDAYLGRHHGEVP